jgi:hypothetical protein
VDQGGYNIQRAAIVEGAARERGLEDRGVRKGESVESRKKMVE